MSGHSSNKREKLASKVARVLNSAMAFAIAYVGIMFFFYLVTGIVGKALGFDAQVYYYGVKFQLGRHTWNIWNVFLIWSAGTVFTFFLGILCLFLYSYFREKIVLANLVSLWAAVICFSVVAAQTLLPCLSSSNDPSAFYTNLSIVFAYLNLPGALSFINCVVFLGLLTFFSSTIAKSYLSFSYSFSKVNKRNRKQKYFLETIFLPYMIACALLLVFFEKTYQYPYFVLQNMLYMFIIGLSLLVSFVVASIIDINPDEVLRYKNLQQINAVMFVVLISILIFLTVTYQGFYLPF